MEPSDQRHDVLWTSSLKQFHLVCIKPYDGNINYQKLTATIIIKTKEASVKNLNRGKNKRNITLKAIKTEMGDIYTKFLY